MNNKIEVQNSNPETYICKKDEEATNIDENNRAVDDLIEWQNHQYDPGYYTGGKIPGWVSNKKNKKVLSMIIFLSCLCWISLSIMTFAKSYITLNDMVTGIFGIVVPAIFMVLSIKTLFKSKTR